MVAAISKVLALLLFPLSCVSTASVVGLSGCKAHWELSNSNRSITLPDRVPGYALQSVSEHNLIGDPLSG